LGRVKQLPNLDKQSHWPIFRRQFKQQPSPAAPGRASPVVVGSGEKRQAPLGSMAGSRRRAQPPENSMNPTMARIAKRQWPNPLDLNDEFNRRVVSGVPSEGIVPQRGQMGNLSVQAENDPTKRSTRISDEVSWAKLYPAGKIRLHWRLFRIQRFQGQLNHPAPFPLPPISRRRLPPPSDLVIPPCPFSSSSFLHSSACLSAL
jgi:hypothetical protein